MLLLLFQSLRVRVHICCPVLYAVSRYFTMTATKREHYSLQEDHYTVYEI